MYANRRNFRVLKEIGAEEHDGDVRFQTGSGNTAVSRFCQSQYLANHVKARQSLIERAVT